MIFTPTPGRAAVAPTLSPPQSKMATSQSSTIGDDPGRGDQFAGGGDSTHEDDVAEELTTPASGNTGSIGGAKRETAWTDTTKQGVRPSVRVGSQDIEERNRPLPVINPARQHQDTPQGNAEGKSCIVSHCGRYLTAKASQPNIGSALPDNVRCRSLFPYMKQHPALNPMAGPAYEFAGVGKPRGLARWSAAPVGGMGTQPDSSTAPGVAIPQSGTPAWRKHYGT